MKLGVTIKLGQVGVDGMGSMRWLGLDFEIFLPPVLAEIFK